MTRPKRYPGVTVIVFLIDKWEVCRVMSSTRCPTWSSVTSMRILEYTVYRATSIIYSKTSLLWTPLGLIETVHINRAISLEGVNAKRYIRTFSMRSLLITVIRFIYWAAFDSVWHDGLIYKLNDLRLPRYLLRYLVSFLYNHTATIEIENILSRPFKLNSGTPQGSPLSPLLYIIYTADSMTGIPQHTEHGLFADDTALWTSSNTIASLSLRLQQSVDAFVSWCNSWKLKLQPTKTEMIHFTVHPRKKYKPPVTVKIENTTIQPVDTARYLGVIIDKQLKWRNHIQHIESKVTARISILRYLSKSAKEPNPKTMINIYKSIVRTVIISGYPVLLTANDKLWERLQIIQNRAIRAALNLPIYTSVDYIHRITALPKIKQYAISLLTKSIHTSTINNDNTLKKHLDDILQQL